METEPTAQPGAEPNTITVENAVVTQPTKTTWGLTSFNQNTPKWASNLFDFYFILSKAVLGYIAASHLLTTTQQYEVTIFITLLLDVIVRGLTKMFGVSVDTDK